jgi:hypothetical protein
MIFNEIEKGGQNFFGKKIPIKIKLLNLVEIKTADVI